MARISSNAVSGPGTWGMTTDHSVLMNIIPSDHPDTVGNIDLELPAGHNINIMLPAGHNIDVELVV